MPSSPGRSTDSRTQANVGTTNASTAITFPSGTITAIDVGRPISGTGIPTGATIATVGSATAGTISANATATGTITATIGVSRTTPYGAGFTGWSPETAAEALTQSIPGGAGASDPARQTDAVTRVGQRNR